MKNLKLKSILLSTAALIAVAATVTTIGPVSAQDTNIKHMFAAVGAHEGWKWDTVPTPIVISAEVLGQDQKGLLEAAYGEQKERA